MSLQKSGRGLASEMAQLSAQLHERGWVANHDGNLTAKDGARYWATPTATSKRMVSERSLLQLDASGAVVEGNGKVFGELGLHLTVYQRRPDVGAVIHAHPPHATAIAASRGAGNPIAVPFLHEAVVSLGPCVPRLAAAMPGEPAKAALAPWCEWVDAVLLGNHGVLAWGATLEQAFLRLELVEHLAKIAIAAAPLGGVEPLPVEQVRALMAARAKAGLGRAAERAVETLEKLLREGQSAAQAVQAAPVSPSPRAVVACAPAPHSSTPILEPQRSASASSGAAPSADVAAIVREEIVRALREAT